MPDVIHSSIHLIALREEVVPQETPQGAPQEAVEHRSKSFSQLLQAITPDLIPKPDCA
jgi:hypothetical protein